MVNICPVCGYLLKWPPADFHICPSCGTEFGYDDAGRTHSELRAMWLRSGAEWWSPTTQRPEHWDAYLQLDNLINRPNTWQTALAGKQVNSDALGSMISNVDGQNRHQAAASLGGTSPRGLHTAMTHRAA